jgi:26S proteasome regulatory subunit N5
VTKAAVAAAQGSSDSAMDASTTEEVAPAATEAFAARQKVALESTILFLLASKFDNHQSDMTHRLKAQLTTLFKTVPLDPLYANALNLFTTHEIVHAPFPGQDTLEGHASLSRTDHLSEETAEFFRKQLRDRTVQHNLRVVGRYYTQIRSKRLAVLLGLTYDVLEVHLAEIASAGDLYLKIDRPAGVVSFHQRPQPEQVLSDWASDVGKMLHLMESTCHIINRENMVYKV